MFTREQELDLVALMRADEMARDRAIRMANAAYAHTDLEHEVIPLPSRSVVGLTDNRLYLTLRGKRVGPYVTLRASEFVSSITGHYYVSGRDHAAWTLLYELYRGDGNTAEWRWMPPALSRTAS